MLLFYSFFPIRDAKIPVIGLNRSSLDDDARQVHEVYICVHTQHTQLESTSILVAINDRSDHTAVVDSLVTCHSGLKIVLLHTVIHF